MPVRDSETGIFLPDQTYTSEELLEQLRECERRYGEVTRALLNSDDDFASRSAFDRHFGTLSNAKRAADLENKGRIYLTEPRLTELNERLYSDTELQSICTGLLLGDGSIDTGQDDTEALLAVGMTNEQFLNWLDEKLGDITTGVRLTKTAKESAAHAQSTGFRPNAIEDNYHDFYLLRTRRLPFFSELRGWYSSGKKRIPDKLSLTPEMLRMWYCCDGGVNITNSTAELRCRFEADRGSFVESLFDNTPLNPDYTSERIHFRDESTSFLEWIGEAPPGFEYKWELDRPAKYRTLKKLAYYENQ